jgi:succinylglutamate desuccinylase/L-amino acid N-acyltransferase YncA
MDSFLALVDHIGESFRQKMIDYATAAAEGELSAAEFEKNYFARPGFHFWVAEQQSQVVGCVGIKRTCFDEAELVRMAVSPTLRGGGVGSILITELIEYCKANGALRIALVTGNPDAARFYEKNGFVKVSPGPGFKMVRYLGERVIRKVAIIGGTHGNERIGVELVRQWRRNPSELCRSSLETQVLLGNPAAVEKNVRFIDSDLNREFTGRELPELELILETGGSDSKVSSETQRAHEVNGMLGPKGAADKPTQCDFVIDLHSSNSNVGLVAMISSADVDCYATRLCRHLLEDEKCKNLFPGLHITTSEGTKGDSYSIDSVPPYGISFEVGPLPHGTLSSPLLEKTRQLVLSTLDFIEAHNLRLLTAAGDDGNINRWSGRDAVLADTAPDLIQQKGPFHQLECYTMVGRAAYPPLPIAGDATSEDSLSAVSNGGQSSFPTNVIIHPDLEGRDWKELVDGEPAFITTDGTMTTIPFVAPKLPPALFGPPPSEKIPLYPLFINEAAYQQAGVAFGLYKKVSKPVF